ncbi:response regulator [bacterium]|nr:response regulator [bacterium]
MVKILAIDDQRDNLLVVSTMLSDLIDNSVVLTAGSGLEGIEKANRELPDVILLDVIMAGIDGFETCRRLKANPLTKHIPIIMLTAIRTDSESHTKGLELGADAFLSKPIEEAELVAQVEAMLRIKRAEDQLRQEKIILEDLVNEKVNELRKSENRYQMLVRTSPDGFTACDLDGRVLDANPAFLDMLDYTMEELRYKTLFELTPSHWHKMEKEIISKALSEGGNTKNEIEYIRKDGTIIPVFLSSWVIMDENGNPEQLSTFVQDITERKNAEKERALLASALEQTAESIIITDSQGKILYVNPAFETTSGFAKENVIGNHFDSFVRNIQEIQSNEQMWINLRDGLNWSGTIVTRKKDGNEIEEEITVSPIRDKSGLITNFVASKFDVSREKQLEKQLLQAQKMEALGTLAGGIAHDFNNVLHGMSMSAHTALKKLPEDSLIKKYLDRMLIFCDRGAALVKQILTFSRHMEEKFSVIEIASIVKEVLIMMKSALPSTITIEQNIADSAGNISGNPSQIHQIVMNLCSNAGYAMRETGGVLRVSLKNVHIKYEEAWSLRIQRGHYLDLTISDTGSGMSQSVQERIFEPFYTTKPKGEGTGLGLSVVHGIVKAHNGHVQVDSKIGEGTSFKIRFPIVEETIIENKEEKNQSFRGNERILLVDDEDTMVDLMNNILGDLGYSVKTAYNGREALDLFNKDPFYFDLVITDQTMPEITGDELAKIFKAKNPELPIILMTGFSYKIDKVKAEKIGIDEVLMKPFEVNNLVQLIRRLMKSRDQKFKPSG